MKQIYWEGNGRTTDLYVWSGQWSGMKPRKGEKVRVIKCKKC